MNFRNLKIVFSCFPSYTEESPIDQKIYFIKSINNGWIDVEGVKVELQIAFNDATFSWKSIARQKDFIHYTEDMTEKEVLIEFKLLIWDVIFKDEVLGKDEIREIQAWLFNNLSVSKKANFKDLMEEINKLQIVSKPIDEYELLRAYYNNNGYNKILLEHKAGTEEWFYSLRSEAIAWSS